MRFLLLFFVLLLGGCAVVPPTPDYDLVETQPNGVLLPPPAPLARDLTNDTYYRDVEDARLVSLKKYQAYITRQIRAVEPGWGVERKHCGDVELPGFVAPAKPHIHPAMEPEDIIVELTLYIRELKLAQNRYQSAAHDAVVAACKR